MAIYGPYPATVSGIHDGDTISVVLDLGFGIQATQFRCRLWGIDAPELRTELGKESLAYLQTLIQTGDHLRVVSHGWDKYGGRFDGEVWKLGSETTINRLMVEAGKAASL